MNGMLPEIFDPLPQASLKAQILDKHEVLFRQNDDSFALFFLQTGSVQLVRHTMSGDEICIHRARSGETFAEASLFSKVYHCDAVCLDKAVVVAIEKRAVLAAMAENPAFAMAITARFASQIQFYRRRLELRSIRSAEERVLAAIADGLLSKSIKTLAAEIGLTHEASYRALAKLVKQGKLRKTAHGVYAMA